MTFPSPEPETALVALLFTNYIFFLDLSLGLRRQKDFNNVNKVSKPFVCGKKYRKEKKKICVSLIGIIPSALAHNLRWINSAADMIDVVINTRKQQFIFRRSGTQPSTYLSGGSTCESRAICGQ